MTLQSMAGAGQNAIEMRALRKVYKETYEMERFLEPGQFLLAYGAKRLWAYFDAFTGASADMQAWIDA